MQRRFYPIRKTRLYKRFFNALAPVVDRKWSRYVSEEENLQAKAALREFLHRAYLLLPKAKRYNFEPLGISSGGTEFLRRTLAVKRNLDQQRWDNACHELYDVLYFHRIDDCRVLYAVVFLLELYLCREASEQPKPASDQMDNEVWQRLFQDAEAQRKDFYFQEVAHWQEECFRKDRRIEELEKQLFSSK